MNRHKKELLKQEKQLRSELNSVTDDFEKRLFKIIGIAAVSGLVTYGTYKLLGPSKKNDKRPKSNKTVNQSVLGGLASKKLIFRLLTALVPIILSKIEKD